MEIEQTDELAASSTVAGTEELEGTDVAGGGTPDGDPESQVPFHEHPRWKAVHGELKSFKALGVTPEQILELGREVQSYREANVRDKQEQRKESRPPTEEEIETEAALKAARADLERVAPELKEIESLKKIVTTLENQAKQVREDADAQAISTLATIMTQTGMSADDQKVASMAKRVAPIIQDSPQLTKLYYRDPVAAVTQAWEIFTQDLELIASRRKGAKLEQKGASLSTLPKGQLGGGGGVPAKGQPPAATIDELFRRERGVLTGKE
jgi:hypothetical protein